MARLSLNSSRKTKSSSAGEIPVDWGCVRLSEVLDKSLTYGVVQPGEHVPNGLFLIRSQDYSQGWAPKDSMMRISPEIEALYERSRVKTGDILITVVGANIGKIAIVPEFLNGANISRSVARVSANTDLISSSYLKAFLNGGISRLLHLNQNGGAQPVLNLEDLRDFALPLPALPEQKKIADILSTWDEGIEKLDAIIAAKDRRYACALEILLKTSGYQRCKVRDITREAGKRNRDLAVDRVLSVTNTQGFVLPSEYFDKQVASADVSNYKIVHRGEFAYNPSRINVGSIARLDRWDVGIVSPIYVVFSLNEKTIHPDFFYHWLQSYEAKSRIRRSAQGSVRDSVNFDDFGGIPFPLPNLTQQRLISEYLNLALQEIDVLRRKRTALDHQKCGLMQHLLTGRIRAKTA